MICIGHRGAKGYEPENTLRSMSRALELGADWIELDVHLVENELVVIHDTRLERTTNGKGRLDESSLDYIRSLDAGCGERVPLLGEAFDLVAGRASINVELKGPGTAEPVVHFLSDRFSRGLSPEHVLISSFDHRQLALVRSLDARLRVGALLVGFPVDGAAFAERVGAYSVNPSLEFVDEAFVSDAHARGLKVLVFTANRPDEIATLFELGVDGIFSDFPDRVLAERDRRRVRL